MKKLLVIIISSVLWFSSGNSAEKIYCVDLDSERYGKYSIYVLPDKNNSGICSKKNVAGGYKDRRLVTLNEKAFNNNSGFQIMRGNSIAKSDLIKYLTNNNLNADIKYIENRKPKISIQKKTQTSQATREWCYDKVDFSWSIPGNGNYAKFEFTSSSEKPVNISKIIIKTKDKLTVLEQNVSVNLKPFGLGSSSVYIGDRNKDAIQIGNYRCSFGSKSKTVSTFKKTKNKSDGWFRWWYILVGVGIIGFLGYVAEGSPKSNKTRSVSSRTSKENIIEIVWEGKETMSKTFWLYCILATVIVSFISGLLLASLGAMIFIAPVVMIIWSNTGLWRSSEIYKNQKLNNKQSYGWATAAKVYVVLNYITTLSQIGLSLNS